MTGTVCSNGADPEEPRLGCSESVESDPAGGGADLLHQEAQSGRPHLPVLQLVLRPLPPVLQPQLLALQQKLLDDHHPLLQVTLKPRIPAWREEIKLIITFLVRLKC